LIYLDSAAVVKLARTERETAALEAWLATRSQPLLVSSALVEVEVPRALRRAAPEALAAIARVLDRITRLEINAAVRARAAGYPATSLRTLDAIHLATADLVAERAGEPLEAFVTYDARLAQAAAAIGLATASPGA
jgi:predicted nucleic acid-binding protein